jgi:peptide/nickel transport system permease protein
MMRNYILQRIILTIPVIVLVTFGAFALLRMIPGSIVDLKAGTGQSQADTKRLEKEFGLDKTIPQQFLIWVKDLARGDLGESLWTTERVSTEIKRRFPATAELALMASLTASTIALVAGTTAAIHQDSWLDRSIQLVTITGLAIPNFVLATLLFSLPAIWWGKVIPEGYVPLVDHPLANVERMIFPALILGAAQAAILTRLVRSTMLEVLRQDYIRTAWAKGLAGRHVILRHALRNAMLPVMTVWGLQIASLLGGTVIMETMFRIPGMGIATLNAVKQRDYGLAQVLILIFGLVYIFTSLVVDVLYAYVDPRIRYQ